MAQPIDAGVIDRVASPAYLGEGLPLRPQDLEHHDYLRDSSIGYVVFCGGVSCGCFFDDGLYKMWMVPWVLQSAPH